MLYKIVNRKTQSAAYFCACVKSNSTWNDVIYAFNRELIKLKIFTLSHNFSRGCGIAKGVSAAYTFCIISNGGVITHSIYQIKSGHKIHPKE